MVDQKLHTLLNEWSGFTAEREAERHRLMNPPGVSEKKTELAEVNQELARLKAKAHLLKAQIAMAGIEDPYNRTTFDVLWADKKKALKETIEQHFMALMKEGKSIPTIMNDYNFRNPVWLYQIKEKLTHHQQVDSVKVENALWYWSHFTGTHRYALAKGEDGAWKYVKMMGTADTDLEGEEAVFDFNTGEFVSGNQEVFSSDSMNGRTKRKDTLAAVLAGTYTGHYKESENPYYS